MSQLFNFSRVKAPFDAYFVTIDIAEWLESETIQTVGFLATKESDGSNATADVLDVGLSSYSGNFVFPYIKGGVDGEIYTALCQVQTLEGSFEEFQVRFRVRDKEPTP